MHPNRIGALAMYDAVTLGWDPPEIVFRKLSTRAFSGRFPLSILAALTLALRRKFAPIRRMPQRPPSGPAGLPPRMQSCDGLWEDPLLWLLIVH